jgi:hypothetical protein
MAGLDLDLKVDSTAVADCIGRMARVCEALDAKFDALHPDHGAHAIGTALFDLAEALTDQRLLTNAEMVDLTLNLNASPVLMAFIAMVEAVVEAPFPVPQGGDAA